MMTTTNTSNTTTQAANHEGADLATVMTDMLLEGRIDDLHALHTAEAAAGYDRALAALIARIQANSNHYYATKFPTLDRPTIYIDKSKRGQRFLRIWEATNEDLARGSRGRAVGFVEAATGLLWKAATWKAPARNFSRGSMYEIPRNWAVGGFASIG